MAKIRKIYDQTIKPDGSKTTIYPITSTRAVYTPEGETLDSYLKDGYFHGADLRGYKTVSNVTDLPTTENQFGWLIGEDIYVWVGTGGDTLEGLYQNCGHFRTPYVPDDEDLVADSNNELKLKDRTIEDGGMGYVILRKNKTFADQLTQENTIYEIRYNFALDGGSVEIPADCVLKFNGGKVSNGTIVCNGAFIDADPYLIFENVVLSGYSNELHSKWFCAVDGVTDDSAAFQKLVNSSNRIALDPGTIAISQTIECGNVLDMYGVESNSEYTTPEILFTSTEGVLLHFGHNDGFPYTTISNVFLLGNKPNDAEFYSGTVAVDTTESSGYEQDIRFRNCRFEHFSIVYLSNGRSYYNWLSDCRFSNNGTCLQNVHPNNLNIERCRFGNCNYGLNYTISGDGPLVIDKCAIEAINNRFITTTQSIRKVIISNCYVEAACDRLVSGQISSFSAINNELQIAGTFRTFEIAAPVSIVLVGNNWVFDETHFLTNGGLITLTNPNTSLKSFLWFDTFRHIDRTDISGGDYSPISWINALSPSCIVGSDPVSGKQISSANVIGAARPSSPYNGQVFFDTSVGKPVFYTGSGWVLADGTPVE